jgi:nicotinamide-nucleotide amidase
VRFTASSDETSTVQAYFEELKESLTQLFGDKIYALKDVDLESAFAQLMVEKGLRFGTAESCTGGNISSKLIQRSGASEYFQLALVTYSNEAKISQLNVNPSTLDANGAVSEPVVKEMLEGLLSKGLIDIGVAVSGIAGPTGGSDEKPVGTICIAVGNKTKIRTKSVKFAKDRSRNIEYATMTAINLARKFILENY